MACADEAHREVLEIKGLCFGYERGRPVIEGFSVDLSAGQVCALVGPNAAGKTTLVRLMLGQLKPWEGRICVAGRGVDRIRAEERAGLMSYVPQRGAASFSFTVEQVVAMGRHALRQNAEAVEHALANCDLSGLRGRVYAHLSAGQQQRVLLARAMAQAADGGRVMLLDEPVSAMDLQHVHLTMELLRRLAGKGMAVLVVLHDLNLAARYADRVWLMEGGRLAAYGPWQEVLMPEVLERVYRVRLRAFEPDGYSRPIFTVTGAGERPPQ